MNDIRILKRDDAVALLDNEELKIIDIVKSTYILHQQNKTVLPYSSFLRFNNNTLNRIIALPAYIDKGEGLAGVKWISSFPGNIFKNMERASAVCIVNDTLTGRVKGILEGAVISAERTAASAALAASILHKKSDEDTLGIIGCGYINSKYKSIGDI